MCTVPQYRELQYALIAYTSSLAFILIIIAGKDTSGTRLTYLLRRTHPLPDQSHLTAGTGAGISGLDTPPPTDESALDPESDFALSDIPSDVSSDVESERGIDAHPSVRAAALSDIEESRPGSP